MGRRFAVWLVAWAMRHGVSLWKAEEALEASYGWRSELWRLEVLADAQERNRARSLG